MWSWLETLSHLQQTPIATGFTWGITELADNILPHLHIGGGHEV